MKKKNVILKMSNHDILIRCQKYVNKFFSSSSPHTEVRGKEIINPTCFSAHMFSATCYTRCDLCVVGSLKVLSQAERADPISPSMSLYLKINSNME